MVEALLQHEPALRLLSFLVIFFALVLAERLMPAAQADEALWRRWGRNFGLLALSTLIIRLTLPLLAVGVAIYAESRGLGLLNQVQLPFFVKAIITLITLDCLLYWQHRLLHAVPLLWRLHRTHHIDRHLDVTTGGRFHPFEMFFSMVVKMLVVLILGAPAAAVVLFEIMLNAMSLFAHSNLRLPGRFDRVLRLLIVTPPMHRIHHAEYSPDMSRNFGFSLSVWDRIFGSYAKKPSKPLVIGEAHRQSPRDRTFASLLVDPFRSGSGQ